MAAETSLQAFWQTLSVEMSAAEEVFVGTCALTKSVHKDYEPVVASVGQTVNVALPSSVTTKVVDGQAADPTFNTPDFTYVPIVLNQFFRYPCKIYDFAQFNSPQRVRDLLVDPAIKGLREQINASLWTNVKTSSGGFTVNAKQSSTGALITPDEFLDGLELLAEQKVPVTDNGRMSLVVHPKVYYGMLKDPAWTEYIIAGELATEARRSGILPTTFNVDIKLDQQATATGSAPARTFEGLLLHQYAYGMATRPLPTPDENVVRVATYLIDGIPIQVMLGYNIAVQGYCLIVCAAWGSAVIRPLAGVVMETVESAS